MRRSSGHPYNCGVAPSLVVSGGCGNAFESRMTPTVVLDTEHFISVKRLMIAFYNRRSL